MMDFHQSNSLVSLLLANYVLPGGQRWGMEKMFVAAPRWRRGLELPAGMSLTRHLPLGPRVPMRGRRAYGASSVVNAHWPQDDLHSTRTPKLIFVLSGVLTMRVADYILRGGPGHSVLLPPDTPFNDKFELLSDEPNLYPQPAELLMLLPYRAGLICWVSRRWCDDAGTQHESEETISVPHSQASFYIERLNAEAASAGLHRSKICHGLLGVALALLHRELQGLPVIRTGEIGGEGKLAPTAQREYSLAQAEAYIRHNLRESLSIDKVARHLCLSRTTFTGQFRAAMGKTFTQYVADLRFAEAERLLRDSDLAIHDICALVGFKPDRLRTLFQERKGLSPTRFRHKKN